MLRLEPRYFSGHASELRCKHALLLAPGAHDRMGEPTSERAAELAMGKAESSLSSQLCMEWPTCSIQS